MVVIGWPVRHIPDEAANGTAVAQAEVASLAR